MTNKIFSQSPDMKQEYCASIVRIGEVKPIEGSDFLGVTLVNGIEVVVRKDAVHEGNIMFFAPQETALNLRFLAVNNQFEMGDYELIYLRNSLFLQKCHKVICLFIQARIDYGYVILR